MQFLSLSSFSSFFGLRIWSLDLIPGLIGQREGGGPAKLGSLRAPVLLTAFNRADVFENALGKISFAKPRHVYVHIDGPKSQEDADEQVIMKSLIRNAELSGLKVSLRILETNLGCGAAVNAALDTP